MSAIRLKLVECRAILGGERDPFRVVWDEQATAKDRKRLLLLAHESSHAAAWRAGYAWVDLPPDLREKVKSSLKKFAAWAEKLQ